MKRLAMIKNPNKMNFLIVEVLSSINFLITDRAFGYEVKFWKSGAVD